jgi:hypothetical protein
MNRNLKKAVAAATISGALGFSAVAMGAGVANADDDHGPWVPWVPWQPGQVWQNWVARWVPWYPGKWIPQPWHGGDDWGEWDD